MKFASIIFLCYLLSAFGCDIVDSNDNHGIVVKTDRAEYVNGSSIGISVENQSERPRRIVAITPCSCPLLQQIGSQWRSIALVPDSVCHSIRIGTVKLQPGTVHDTQLHEVQLDEEIFAQPYDGFRLAVKVLPEQAEDTKLETIFSNKFHITATAR